MPSSATLEVPTMFRIAQNWPALHFQEFFFRLKSVLANELESLTLTPKTNDFSP